VGQQAPASGPDFSAGVRLSDLPEEGTLAGRARDVPILVSRFAGELFAVGGACTHYSAALADGLVHSGEVRCPLHHACFDLKTGAPLRAPALDPLDRWRVDQEGELLFVREKLAPTRPQVDAPAEIRRVVLVGGGAASLACASELRRLGYQGAITMLSADADPPCDRPNLSKDFLAGTAPAEWIPLRSDDWYRDHSIELRLNTKVHAIDTADRTAVLETGERFDFDALLLATGSEAKRLNEQDFGGDRVFTLRTVADARAIIEQATAGARAAIIGSSFIGLETAAALRARGVEVEIISPEHVPFEKQFGGEFGGFLQKLHEQHGVRFHMGTAAARFDGSAVSLANGQRIEADFVLVGVGASPRTGLAEVAGLEVANGVWVDGQLETSCPGVYAAGDIAAYPDPRTGERVRIEHWAIAEQQGQTVARNMLGGRERFDNVPFFWTEQHGLSVRYVGHASDWDETRIDGEVGEDGFVVRYYREGEHVATASVNRDRDNLEDELRFEERMAPATSG
jgi:apoptosis-inducing factor 3